MRVEIAIRYVPDDFARVADFLSRCRSRARSFRSADALAQHHGAGKLGEIAFARVFGWDVNWAISPGDGGFDFAVGDGETVDVKSIDLRIPACADRDFVLPIGGDESRGSTASHFVQVLVVRSESYAILTGGISRSRFATLAERDPGLAGPAGRPPLVVRRSQLSTDWPARFYRLQPARVG